jgi:hypothetical protein
MRTAVGREHITTLREDSMILTNLRAFFISAALVFLCGCSHIVPVMPSSSGLSSANKLQQEVGLILSDDLKRFQVNETKMGDTWNYANLGQASADHYRAYLESRFKKVTLVTADSGPWTNHGFAAVFDPRISGFTFDIPITKFQVYPATIRYSVTVYGPGKQVVYKSDVSGVGDTAGSPGFDFAANPSKSASKAVEEGVRLSVENSLAAPAVRGLFGGAPSRGSAKDL